MTQLQHTFNKDFMQYAEVATATFEASGEAFTHCNTDKLIRWTRASDGYILRTVYGPNIASAERTPISHVIYDPRGNEAAREMVGSDTISLHNTPFMQISRRNTGWSYVYCGCTVTCTHGTSDLHLEAQAHINGKLLANPHQIALWCFALNAEAIEHSLKDCR